MAVRKRVNGLTVLRLSSQTFHTAIIPETIVASRILLQRRRVNCTFDSGKRCRALMESPEASFANLRIGRSRLSTPASNAPQTSTVAYSTTASALVTTGFPVSSTAFSSFASTIFSSSVSFSGEFTCSSSVPTTSPYSAPTETGWSNTAPSSTTFMPTTRSCSNACERDVLILMDTSSGLVTLSNYAAQITFVESHLVANWNVSLTDVEASPAFYDSAAYDELAPYSYDDVQELQQVIRSHSQFWFNDPPSITNALKNAAGYLGESGRQCAPQTTLLFTSTSNSADVASASIFATQLKANGNLLVVIAIGPNADRTILAPLSSGSGFIFSQLNYALLPNDVTLASNINTAAQICTTTPATTALTRSSFPSACTPLPTAFPVFPCQVYTAVILDASSGLSIAEFAQQQAFIANRFFDSRWAFFQVAIGAYDNADVANFQTRGQFDAMFNLADAQNIISSLFRFGDQASIATGLQEILPQYPRPQACISLNTVFFTSTSAPADIAAAMPFADQLKSMGQLIIVAMGTQVNSAAFGQLASTVISWPDYSNAPNNLADSIIAAFHCPTA